ncbi:MAG: CCA tRNA nucleotidyltransferase [Methyloceanibacter sp.]|uniref:CCA tRNA nucleotidyltransferase n=1 Tax=Methyloceanibacter sp. TaxID=1965321 RepID=UPI003D9B809F
MSKSERVSAPPSLKEAEWLQRPETAKVFAALNAEGIETRAVGGAVRDALLGLPVTEIDLATTAVPQKVMTLAREAGLKAIPTGIEHGTVTVVVNDMPFEVTTLRRDVETFGRHAKVAFTEDWEEDARRRDFTLNALYADREGIVFDPLGFYADLMDGRVRFIGDAEARIKEDYLRILRFFRFNAYYGRGPLDADGLAASVKLREGLAQLSAERVAAEMWRLLVAPRAMRGLEALYDYGLLTDVLGGVPRLDRVERLIDIEAALDLTPDAALRLAALAVFVREDAVRLADRLHLSNAEQATLEHAADEGGKPVFADETSAKEALYGLGENDFRSGVLLAWAASGASTEDPHWRAIFRLPRNWEAPVFPLRGADLVEIGTAKGPEIGELLRQLEAEWIAGGFAAASREELLARAKELKRADR